jgi:hypothetical protein
MHRIGKEVFILVLGMSVALAEDARQDEPATSAEKYQALLKERQDGPEDLSKAKTPEERKQVQASGEAPAEVPELAEENPKVPVALQALIQTVSFVNSTAFPDGGKDSPGTRALALLLRDHVLSDKLGPVCQQVLFGFHKSHEQFRAAPMNPHAGCRPRLLSLAQCCQPPAATPRAPGPARRRRAVRPRVSKTTSINCSGRIARCRQEAETSSGRRRKYADEDPGHILRSACDQPGGTVQIRHWPSRRRRRSGEDQDPSASS